MSTAAHPSAVEASRRVLPERLALITAASVVHHQCKNHLRIETQLKHHVLRLDQYVFTLQRTWYTVVFSKSFSFILPFSATVLPIIGNLLAVGLFASPWVEVKVARATGDNGKLNAVPYAAMLAQCACWVVYAALQNSLAVAPINLVRTIRQLRTQNARMPTGAQRPIIIALDIDISARSSKSVYLRAHLNLFIRFQFGCVCGLIFCVSTMRNVKDRDEYLRQERLFFLALALPSICLLTVCMAVQDLATKINIVRLLFLREFALGLIFHSNPTRLCHNVSIHHRSLLCSWDTSASRSTWHFSRRPCQLYLL
jgi:hypothetical protein